MIEDYECNSSKKGFDCETLYNDKYWRTKTKSYDSEINITFHNNRMSKEGSHCICLSAILIDSVFKSYKLLSTGVFRTM